MPFYSYKCLDSKGKTIKGSMEADNEKALRVNLKQNGYFVEEIKLTSDKGHGLSKEIDFSFLSSVSTIDIAMVTRQIATLLRASVPLTETLTAISEQLRHDKKRKKLATIIGNLKTTVNEGSSFAEALKKHPKEFNDLYVSMVRSGEAAGNLDEVMFSLSEFLEKRHKLITKIKTAMTYPIVMVFITIGIVAILMTSVVPNVISVIDDTGQELPIYTKILIGLSDFFTNHWFGFFTGLGVLIYLFKRWKAGNGRPTWDRIKLHMPIVGDLVRNIAISRFASTMSTMLKSGVSILKCLDIVKSVVGNTVLQEVIAQVEISIKEGESMGKVLERSGEFPPLVTHMIAIGEQSGQLEEMLENVAITYETEVDTVLTRLTSILEPIMILIMGGIVTFVIFSILMPIMQMSDIGM